VEASQVLAELRHDGIIVEFARPRDDAPEQQILTLFNAAEACLLFLLVLIVQAEECC
jgi:hypothetical protein